MVLANCSRHQSIVGIGTDLRLAACGRFKQSCAVIPFAKLLVSILSILRCIRRAAKIL